MASAPELLLVASDEKESDDVVASFSAEGTADDVLAGDCSDVCGDADGKSEDSEPDDDSEPADAAADKPSSYLDFHMKAPTYACALIHT